MLLQRALEEVQDQRERAKSVAQLRAEVHAFRQREQELLEQLTALLDDAQRAVCEAFPAAGT